MRHIKLLAAVTIVLVALSGFSPARSSGGGRSGGSGVSKSSSGGSGGGGCSSKSSSSHSSSSSSGGGGYSSDGYSSSSGNDGYSSGDSDGYGSSSGYGGNGRYDNNRTTSSSTSSGSSRDSTEASGTVTECAAAKGRKLKSKAEPGAVVRVRNTGRNTGTFSVRVDFRDADGTLVDNGSAVVTVPVGRSKSVEVPMDHPEVVRDVEECEVSSVA
ncbi:hypothetical protein ACTWQF_29535 [Streptomyces sp. 8N114]|uniref:hypothetical protein n=1 Tax=Streptomyces sp. 8N114 TaxID=3457419 RepID=UPI003FD61052